jgi:hypothetical protein
MENLQLVLWAKTWPPGIGAGIGGGRTSARRVVEWMRQGALVRQEEAMKARTQEKAVVPSKVATPAAATLRRGPAAEDKDDSEADVTDEHVNSEIESDAETKTRGAEKPPASGGVHDECETERRRLLLENTTTKTSWRRLRTSDRPRSLRAMLEPITNPRVGLVPESTSRHFARFKLVCLFQYNFNGCKNLATNWNRPWNRLL